MITHDWSRRSTATRPKGTGAVNYVATLSIRAIIFLLLLCSLSQKVLSSEDEERHVITLTDDNFEHLTQASTGQTTGKWFVNFYAPWCGHCKKLSTVWEDFASKISNENLGIIVAKCDMTTNIETRDRFDVKGFPTLIYFADRGMYTYKGERTVDDLYNYAMDGYKTSSSNVGSKEKVPPPLSWYDKTKRQLKSNQYVRDIIVDFEHIIQIRKNAAIILVGIGTIIGILFAYLLGATKRIHSSESDVAIKDKGD